MVQITPPFQTHRFPMKLVPACFFLLGLFGMIYGGFNWVGRLSRVNRAGMHTCFAVFCSILQSVALYCSAEILARMHTCPFFVDLFWKNILVLGPFQADLKRFLVVVNFAILARIHVRALLFGVLQSVAACCSVLQVCCIVLQCVAVCCSLLLFVAVRCSVLRCVAERCSVCRSVLQCVAVCCSV